MRRENRPQPLTQKRETVGDLFWLEEMPNNENRRKEYFKYFH